MIKSKYVRVYVCDCLPQLLPQGFTVFEVLGFFFKKMKEIHANVGISAQIALFHFNKMITLLNIFPEPISIKTAQFSTLRVLLWYLPSKVRRQNC